MTEGQYPYPLQDRPISLPSGRVVRLYNVFTLRPGPPTSYTVQYGSAIPEGDGALRRAEAAEVITFFAEYFASQGATRASAQICGTRAQAEMREAPECIFRFERRHDGLWQGTDA